MAYYGALFIAKFSLFVIINTRPTSTNNICIIYSLKKNCQNYAHGDFAASFDSKVASIRTAIDGASPPTFTDVVELCRPTSQSSLRLFTPLSCDATKLVHSASAKQSSLDPTLTWLLKDYIDLISSLGLSDASAPRSTTTSSTCCEIASTGSTAV